ncbi:MAG: hypothetical protein Q9160_005516 [Pyrenula sp. 1 TL-2023]
MAKAAQATRNALRPRSAKRKYVSYAESSTEEETDLPPKQLRPSTRQRIDYRESSTDGTSFTDAELGRNSSIHNPRVATSHRPQPRRRSNRNRPHKKPNEPKAIQKPPQRTKSNDAPTKEPEPIQRSSGKPMPWQTLPYDILFHIFCVASEPLYDKFSRRPTSSIEWLLRMSTLCKSFHEAAISALLFSPPLNPSVRANGLLARLQESDRLMLDYRKKIRRLDVDVKQLLRKNGPNLVELIRYTPQLKDLAIHSVLDQTSTVVPPPPSRAKWSYPPQLFDVLDEAVRLRSFEFNGRFPNTESVLTAMCDALSRQSFNGLQTLTLFNLVGFETKPEEDEDDPISAITIASALSSLSNLQRLTMTNCSILNEVLLSRLPEVSHLSLINCGDITSRNLQEYLKAKGRGIRELSLVGNQSLSLAFASGLEDYCPNLRVFHMNFTYADRSAYHDVDPHFDQLLPLGSLPTWPKSLEAIELIQLRRLSVSGAEGFLETLLEAGASLKFLRSLSLKIILKEGWRERSALRTKYTTKLEHMFLRRASQAQSQLFAQSLRASSISSSRPSSSHSTASVSSFAGVELSTRRKSARVAQKEERNSRPTADDASASRASEDMLPRINHQTIQGMCNVVRLQVDDQRPTEFQFNENHFLNDDDDADDGEWNGQDRVVESGGYAW